MATDYSKLNERINRLEVEVEQLKEEINTLDNLKETSITLKTQYAYISNALDELRTDMKLIKSRPAKFWDYALTVIIGTIIGFIITKFLGG